MTTTLATMSRSNEGKRNRKTTALNALLSATALGLFLEGCGTTTTTATRTCTYNDQPVSCDEYDRLVANPPTTTYTPSTITSGGSCTINGQPCSDYFSAAASALGVEGTELSAEAGESGDELLVGSSDADTLDGGGTDTTSYADSDEDDEVDLSEDNEENFVSTEDDTTVVAQNDDIIEGTSGNDILKGGAGADTYVFSEGDGEDTVVEVAEEGVVNTLMFEGDYEASDFSFERSSEDAKDLVVIADTDGDGEAENEVTLEGYFTSETSTETAYSIVVQINDEEAFVPSLEG